ncbi:MAG: hypothetical protein JJU29_16365 [Verrucomicrobia bacterium]|nr:hypothetical protein [Verrucomicrobiota bacterium]MCH8513628.1 hypothetical protein [Kiritimatiellia bacterium]
MNSVELRVKVSVKGQSKVKDVETSLFDILEGVLYTEKKMPRPEWSPPPKVKGISHVGTK